MNTFYKVSLIVFSIIITVLCLMVYNQNKEIEKIKKQTIQIERNIEINSFNRGFNNSFNNGYIYDKVLNSEQEIEDLKDDLESTKSDLEDMKSDIDENNN